MEERYNFHAIERKWRQRWEVDNQLFPQDGRLDMSGLRRLWAMDVAQRYRKMRYGGAMAALSSDESRWVGPVVFRSSHDVVDPDYAVEMYGADATRLYLMFAAPLRREVKWDTSGVEGAYKFLNRIWDLGVRLRSILSEFQKAVAGEISGMPRTDNEGELGVWQCAQRTLHRVTEQLERGEKYNTAISGIMVMVHGLEEYVRTRTLGSGQINVDLVMALYKLLLCLLAPFVPCVAEELWISLGYGESVHAAYWPEYDAASAAEEPVNVVVQVNGRLCQVLQLPAGIDEAAMKEAAQSDEKVRARLAGKRIERVVVVKPKLVNFVVD